MLAESLEDLLRACTVQVTGGPMPGTGFFVAPGKIVTCVHVAGDSHTLKVIWNRDDQDPAMALVSDRVAVLEGGGRPIPALVRDYPDIAVLEVAGLDDHPCVSVDPEWPAPEDTFQVFGYPREGGSVLLTPAMLSYRGTKGTRPGVFLDLGSDRIKGGMSGAAVLNLRTGGVCGVIVASKDTACPDGALAVPWSAVNADLAEVLAASRLFHRADRRWHAATTAGRRHVWFRLPWVVDHFTGRDELLTQLDAALNQHHAGVITQAVSGLGGVGKTQLAAAYVAAHHDEFEVAAWIRAEDGGIADLADLAVALALPVAGRTPPERATDVLAFLSSTDRRWLLVLDNVPGPQALTRLPASGYGRILVTSRHRGGYGAFGTELPVDVFDPTTAQEFLLSRSGRTGAEAANANAVAAALGYLPLALTHAGAYCAAGSGLPFADYLALLEDLPSQDLFDTNPEIFYQHTVAATWNTSITAAQAQAPLARRALEMAAFLAPEAIPRPFFTVLSAESALGRKQVADALAALHRYSLAAIADNGATVHRLLQKVIRDQLADSGQRVAVSHALSAIEQAIPQDPDLPAAWPQWQELLLHITAIADSDGIAPFEPARLVRVLNPTCDFLFSAGFARRALDLAARAVSLSETCLGAGAADTLRARGNLALAFWRTGRISEAIALLEQVAADSERSLGPDHPDTLRARGDLATAYWSAGFVSRAITIQEHVAADSERVLGPDHPQTLRARGNLAGSYRAAGRPREAIIIQEQVAADRERILGPDHPDTLRTRGNLALSYRSAGRAGDGIILLERVAADRERILGPDHPDTLRGRGNLAVAYRSAGRTREALTLLERVAADRERILGPDHPDTLLGRSNLAVAYRVAGRTGEALTLLERVAADRERILGPDHPDTLLGCGNLAVAYRVAGRTGEALTLLEQVTTDSERILGPDHPGTFRARGNLASAYRMAGLADEAITILEQVVADSERIFGPDHPETLRGRGHLASSYYAAGRPGVAITLQGEVTTARERILGPNHPDTVAARSNLAKWKAEPGGKSSIQTALAAVVATLTQRQRQLYKARLVDGRSAAQIAELTGYSPKTVSNELAILQNNIAEGIRVWILAQEGNPYCSDLARLLAAHGWNGVNFSQSLRLHLRNHIDDCHICDDCRQCRRRSLELIGLYEHSADLGLIEPSHAPRTKQQAASSETEPAHQAPDPRALEEFKAAFAKISEPHDSNDSQAPDADLVNRALGAGTPEERKAAVASIAKRYHVVVLRLCVRWLHDLGKAQDVCQAAFVAAYTLLGEGRGPERPDNLAEWLIAIARHHAQEYLPDDSDPDL